MDISKLTISGFKSFYEKSVFTFDKNITGIVGPNGSGKSNITEAMRFVLGEQSAKSMRGKDVTDLLFRGNNTKSNKATVTVDFKKSEFKNGNNLKGNIENIFIKNALEKDSINISRSVYADGKSEYMMNGVEVRLKDIQEFMLYINLGNKSSWHISQGEADRVLLANISDRKILIEDALGLKVYHARINESLKKLDKTKFNIREATIKRKEIIPELSALGRQVEKIRKSKEFREELVEKSSIYLIYKKNKLEKMKESGDSGVSLDEMNLKYSNLQQEIAFKEKNLYSENRGDIHVLELELEREEKVLNILKDETTGLENVKRKIGNNLDYLNLEYEKNKSEVLKIEEELRNVQNLGNDIIFNESDIKKTGDQIEYSVEKIMNTDDLVQAKQNAHEINFTYKKLTTIGSIVNKDNVKQISYLQSIKTRLQEKMQESYAEIEKFKVSLEEVLPDLEKNTLKYRITNERVEELKKQILEFKFLKVETEREIQKAINDLSNLQMNIRQKIDFNDRLINLQNEIENDLKEFKSILGNGFEPKDVSLNENDTLDISALKRNVDRLSIRLEESNVLNPEEIVKSFEDMTERDNFLIKEISDLESSMQNLETLISDLRENLKKEFEEGLEHINIVFDSYVKKLFGGGSGKLFVVEVESRRKSVEDDDSGESEEIKTGIEVEVEIPKKKVKGLHSLSGGERALVSIALNFSIINQNPSPFMILDETDATLDEANAKRYGEILAMLKKHTKLIVVTHNRETMHFADQVYGVTLAKEGYSKVLSVSFEEATEYAK